jgi:type III secretion protein R
MSGKKILLLLLPFLFLFPMQLLPQEGPTVPSGRSVQSVDKTQPMPDSMGSPEVKKTGSGVLDEQFDNFKRPTLITQAVTLSLLSLLPFIVMILSSFLKIVIVLSLLRSALGVQQAPPNQIINGVAFMLSLFVMYPTAMKMYDSALSVVERTKAPDSLLSTDSSTYILNVASAAKDPLKGFLKKNSLIKHQALFYRMAYKTLPDVNKDSLKPDDMMILIPAYITSQLKDAFEIGVLIYIPFFVIDLVTSNILLAMGMMMLSPVTISMPLKLFLLVMLDGWTLLIEGLVATFR